APLWRSPVCPSSIPAGVDAASGSGRASASETLLEPPPALLESGLEAAIRGPVVVGAPREIVREVGLPGDAVRLVVRIDVPLPVPEPGGPGIPTPPQVGGHRPALARPHVR